MKNNDFEEYNISFSLVFLRNIQFPDIDEVGVSIQYFKQKSS